MEDSEKHCSVLSFIFQFSVLGSQCWYLMIAVDLWLSLFNPFTDPKAYAKFYHAVVWLLSLVSGVVLVATNSTSYRDGMDLCWIRATTKLESVNIFNWLLFFAPTLIFWFLSVAVIIVAAYQLKKGLRATFQVRRRTLKNGVTYVIGFALYWLVAGILYFVIWHLEKGEVGSTDFSHHSALYATFAVIIAVRGVVDVCVWFFNQKVYECYYRWWYGLESPEEPLDINRALRREVLMYSTQGICESVDLASRFPFREEIPRLNMYPSHLSITAPDPPVSKVCLMLRRSSEENEASEIPFYDFAPQVFRHLRRRFHISDEAYKRSIRGNTEAMIEKYTEGRSGSFFYFSEDGEYIVKTLTTGEAKFLLQFLPHYTNYMSASPHSFVSKYCGLHAIQLYRTTLYFVVMQSVFLTNRVIHERYDLKGSWVDRRTKSYTKKHKKNAIMKDMDLQRVLRLSDEDRASFLAQIKRDSDFLRDNNIMDYSLLLGIHNTMQVFYIEPESHPRRSIAEGVVVHEPPFFQRNDGGLYAAVMEGPGIYFMGIIDILQEYNTAKKLERFFKIYFRCKHRDGISAIGPVPYGQRFVNFMHKITESAEYVDMVRNVSASISKLGPSLDITEESSRKSAAAEFKRKDKRNASTTGSFMPSSLLASSIAGSVRGASTLSSASVSRSGTLPQTSQLSHSHDLSAGERPRSSSNSSNASAASTFQHSMLSPLAHSVVIREESEGESEQAAETEAKEFDARGVDRSRDVELKEREREEQRRSLISSEVHPIAANEVVVSVRDSELL